MKRSPRREDKTIATQRSSGQVLFSAFIIVFSTLFIYTHELSGGSMSRRGQTMALNLMLDRFLVCSSRPVHRHLPSPSFSTSRSPSEIVAADTVFSPTGCPYLPS
ncbi:hypothetical protein FRC12_006855 [Ceratobasidium sp. 428]|nr:hypothetical protein FRC12_006855 [Ceratobasidium sp. 428]